MLASESPAATYSKIGRQKYRLSKKHSLNEIDSPGALLFMV